MILQSSDTTIWIQNIFLNQPDVVAIRVISIMGFTWINIPSSDMSYDDYGLVAAGSGAFGIISVADFLS